MTATPARPTSVAPARRVRAITPGKIGLGLHAALTFAFLYAPIAVLVIFSFSASRYATVWSGFSWKWYLRLFEDEPLHEALLITLALAALSSLIATVLGTAAALGHARLRARSARIAASCFYLPIMVPDIVLGIALLVLFTRLWPFERGLATMTIGHVVLNVCYVFAVVSARIRGFDARLLEAARDLGASAWQTFVHVRLPLLWPGIVGGALLSAAISLDEFVVAYFVTGPGVATLPIEIFAMVKKGVTPEINALATLMLVASVILALLSFLIQKRS